MRNCNIYIFYDDPYNIETHLSNINDILDQMKQIKQINRMTLDIFYIIDHNNIFIVISREDTKQRRFRFVYDVIISSDHIQNHLES